MNDKERCSNGLKNKKICHKQTYGKTSNLVTFYLKNYKAFFFLTL